VFASSTTAQAAAAGPPPGNDLNVRQNSEWSIDLLCAADVCHARGLVADGARAGFVVCFVFAAIAGLTLTGPPLAAPIAIASVFGALGTEALWPLITRSSVRRAAVLQDMFDTELFHLAGMPTWQKLPATSISRLARSFRGNRADKRDWYVDVQGLVEPYAVMVCQRQNLLWDLELRFAWSWRVAAATIGWVVLGVATALLTDWSTRQLFVRWLAPSLPAIAFGARHAFGHWRVARRKLSLLRDLDSAIDRLPPGEPSRSRSADLMIEARLRQDATTKLRRGQPHVPQWFYRMRHAEDERGHRQEAEQFRQRLWELQSAALSK